MRVIDRPDGGLRASVGRGSVRPVYPAESKVNREDQAPARLSVSPLRRQSIDDPFSFSSLTCHRLDVAGTPADVGRSHISLVLEQ